MEQRPQRNKRPRAAAAEAPPDGAEEAAQGHASVPAPAEVAPAPAEAAQRFALVDGSQLEGGGQILRNASALAAITGVTLRVHSIRAGRDKPGLRPQHLTGLQLIAQLTGGTLEGGAVGSSDVTLAPRRLVAGAHTGDTGTAGSCVLLAQSALPCLLFAAPDAAGALASRLQLLGGTDAAMAPPIDYLRLVLLPILRAQLGLTDVDAVVARRGFFPKGGGSVALTATALSPGATLPPLRLERRGAVSAVRGRVFAAGTVPLAVAQRIAAAARSALVAAGLPAGMITLEAVHEPPERARGEGAGITLVAETDAGCLLGASALGERGVSAETVGARCGAALAAALASGACVDEHASDQLIVFMALAAGESRMLAPAPLSLHARTAIAVAAQLTSARFSVLPPGADAGAGRTVPPGACLVVCEGAAVTPQPGGGTRMRTAAPL